MSLDASLDFLRDAVLVFENGELRFLNTAASQLFSVTLENARGLRTIEVLRNYKLEQLLLSGGETELEWGGKILIARVTDETLILEDVTFTRQRERELREVMAVLSHEFRTPVTAVKGLLEALLVMETNPSQVVFDTRKRFLELSLLEIERLVRLSEDLTVGFRPQAERTFVLSEVIERVVRLTSEEFERCGVTVSVSGQDLLVRCDPDKLVQALLNLLENAARHGPNPGEIKLSASLEHHFVLIRVEDFGQELENYQNIFDAKKRGVDSTGSGMGLYILKTIVQAWGGNAWGGFTGSGNEFGFSVPSPN
jgi:two-component system, OmpR family, phosphate regulon sensor histidine kinase PhoR